MWSTHAFHQGKVHAIGEGNKKALPVSDIPTTAHDFICTRWMSCARSALKFQAAACRRIYEHLAIHCSSSDQGTPRLLP